MLFKQFTVVAIAALAASATAIPVTGLTTHPAATDPAVMGAQDPSLAVITHPSAPVYAGLEIEDHDRDDAENASKWGGGWGGSWGGWGNWCWPWWCNQPWWCW
ncbi:hypothetical protein BGZ74_000008 [Mortierella antarctica]|nr:hypothetical protein BGZ74_000008 [Mortierella antarctica]